MPYPEWRAGTRITAAKLAAMQPIVAIKTAHQSALSNSTELVTDNELFLDLEASATYELDGLIFWRGDVNSDVKFAFTFPAGWTVHWGIAGGPAVDDAGYAAGGSAGNVKAKVAASAASGTTIEYAATGGGTDLGGRLSGTIITSATAGRLQMQFGENTVAATPPQVRAGSRIQALRLA